jgi:hypothetical protein
MLIKPVANFSASSPLGYSVQQSPSSEADRFAASQEIPRILWNRKVHYRNKTNEMHIQSKVNHIYRISMLLHVSALYERHLQGAQRILMKLCVCYVI